MTAVGVAAIGAVGALLRWQVTSRFTPWLGLLIVNVVGSFAIGIVASVSAVWGEPVTFGGLGALTSYSSFAVQTESMGSRPASAAYAGATMVFCVAAVALGRFIG